MHNLILIILIKKNTFFINVITYLSYNYCRPYSINIFYIQTKLFKTKYTPSENKNFKFILTLVDKNNVQLNTLNLNRKCNLNFQNTFHQICQIVCNNQKTFIGCQR